LDIPPALQQLAKLHMFGVLRRFMFCLGSLACVADILSLYISYYVVFLSGSCT